MLAWPERLLDLNQPPNPFAEFRAASLDAADGRMIFVNELERSANVLAVAPRHVIMASGNPTTKSRLEEAGCKVSEFDGSEICLPGAGGPTERSAPA